jgi:hypothetical protein
MLLHRKSQQIGIGPQPVLFHDAYLWSATAASAKAVTLSQIEADGTAIHGRVAEVPPEARISSGYSSEISASIVLGFFTFSFYFPMNCAMTVGDTVIVRGPLFTANGTSTMIAARVQKRWLLSPRFFRRVVGRPGNVPDRNVRL